jgi:hypothetical protein
MAQINLSDAESLVLLDFLSRFSNDDVLTIEHPAERRILWDLCCLLEKQVVEAFDPRYQQLLDKARSLVENCGVSPDEKS